MNNQRRREIKKINNFIQISICDESNYKEIYSEASSRLFDIEFEEETAFYNMPDSLQCSIRGMESEEAIDDLNEAIEFCDAIAQMKEYDAEIINDLTDSINKILLSIIDK